MNLLVLPAFLAKQAMAASYIGQNSSTSNTNPYSFATEAIGTADDRRRVVIGAFVWGASPVIDAVTIDGNSCSKHVQESGVVGSLCIASLLWPTGTTATIAISLSSGTSTRAGIGVWRMVGHGSEVVFDTESAFGDPAQDTISVPRDGVIFGFGAIDATSTFTWTGITENFDVSVEAATRYSGAFLQFADAQDVEVTADASTAVGVNLLLVSFG